jgi:hypothetical protein
MTWPGTFSSTSGFSSDPVFVLGRDAGSIEYEILPLAYGSR